MNDCFRYQNFLPKDFRRKKVPDFLQKIVDVIISMCYDNEVCRTVRSQSPSNDVFREDGTTTGE